jgi:hypothetical protein
MQTGKASTFMPAAWPQPIDLQDAYTDRTP